jgi:hypothetical protein
MQNIEESEELMHLGTMMIAAGLILVFGLLISFCCKRVTHRPKKVLPPPPTSLPLFDAPEIVIVQKLALAMSICTHCSAILTQSYGISSVQLWHFIA